VQSDLKDKYNELETKFYDEPTVQQQPTNRDLQRKYEVGNFNLKSFQFFQDNIEVYCLFIISTDCLCSFGFH